MRNNNNDKSCVNFPRNFRYDWVKKNGKPTGIAQVYTSDNKCIYQGPIKNRKPHGKDGKSFYNNGLLGYDGNWKDGKENGKGKCFYDNGVLGYNGNWKDGKMDGKGKCFYDNGKICYNGNWKNGKKDGKGKYYNDGDFLYNGNWKDGKMDGMVNVYNRDGLIRTKEIWKDGKFQRLNSFVKARCRSGVFINAGKRYELSEEEKKTFMNKKREREAGDGDLEIDNNSSQSSLKDAKKHDKKKGF